MSPAAEVVSTVSPASGTLPGRTVRLALPFFSFLLIVYVLPPPRPVLAERHLLDQSWRLILSNAFLHGMQFGRDIVHTYGPWGFVAEPQGDPRIYPWLAGARLLIAFAFICGAAVVADRRIGHVLLRVLFLSWLAVFADPILVVPMLLLVLTSFPDHAGDRTLPFATNVLTLGCALTMWIKFTSFVAVAALAATLVIQDLLNRRRPLTAVKIAASALAFWLLAGQSVGGFPAFLHGALSTAMSYSKTMFVAMHGMEPVLLAVLLFGVVIPATAVFFFGRARLLWPSLAWVALSFFLQLKEIFVRYDDFHVWMGLVNALLPCALILICRADYFDPARARSLTRACAGAVVLLSIVLTVIEIPGVAGFERFQLFTHNMDSLRALLGGRSLSADYRQHLAEFRREEPLRPVTGTAAVFPDDQALLFGNSIEPRLPPIPQSFEAYNAYLSGRNAAFYRGARRPDYVFFEVHPIDGRYPAITDPLSWLALLDCYLPDGNSGPYLVLRSVPCRHSSLDLVSESTARAGDVVAAPDHSGDLIWAEIDVRANAAGSVVALFARPPATLLAVDTATDHHLYSLPAETARAGFLLSPEILTPDSFARLCNSDHVAPAAAVRGIAVVQSGVGRQLSRPIIVFRFYRIRLARR